MGVTREVLQPGDGETFPKSGDTVTLHYTGTLQDGSTFDSSEDREPLTVVIGVGHVVRGVSATQSTAWVATRNSLAPAHAD